MASISPSALKFVSFAKFHSLWLAASSMPFNKLVCVVVMCVVLVAPPGQAAISCGQAFTELSSCIGYAKGGGALTASCCNGVRAMNSAAKTTPDRQQACGCVNTLIRSVPGTNHGLVAGIPAKCGVNLPYKFSLNLDCKSIK